MPTSSNKDSQVQDFSGKQFGNYHLIRPIGEGGYVHVYLGYDVRNPERKVAIAVEIISTSQEEQEHLRREARILLEFDHPHIVRVYDYDIEGNVFYLVMKYYKKGNLHELYPRGKTASVHKIVSHIEQIASALQYTHDHGVIHRDVKPENILVDVNENVLLGDFGLAKQLTSISTSGDVMGTSAYMAPEQWDGDAYSASDQYALAVVAYELLCGKPPFQGSTAAIAGQHKVKVLPDSQLRKLGVPYKVERVLRRALNKRPERRYGSVEEFAEKFRKAVPSQPTIRRVRIPRRALLISAVIVAAAAIGEVSWNLLFGHPYGKPAPTGTLKTSANTSVSSETPGKLTSKQHQTIYTFNQHQAEVQAVAWSPDGNHIASADAQGVIFVWSMREAKKVRHDHQSKVLSISWSPNSKYIASVSQDGVLDIWDATSGDLYRSYTRPGVRVAVWSAMADLAIGIGKTARVYDIPIQRGFTRDNADNIFAGHGGTVNALSFSFDSKKIASASDDYTVCLWNSENAQIIPPPYTGHKDEVLSVGWALQLDLIASAGADHTVQIWNASTRVLFDLYKHGDSEHGYMPVKAVAWAPDGESLVSGGDDNIAKVWKIDKSISIYTGHSASVNAVAVSPDAKYVVSGSDDKMVHVWEL